MATKQILTTIALSLSAGLCHAAETPAATPPASPSAGSTASPISEAETLLFMNEHLKSVPEAQVLRYAFTHRGAAEKETSDSVDVEVRKGADGRQVNTRCLSGAQKVEVQFVDGAKGNPALLCFLEHDIRVMKDLVKRGTHNYYRHRIRLALADHAEVKSIKASYGGKDVAAKEIRISPYLDDPHRAEFERYASKVYVFRLSDEVPGGIIDITSAIPDPANPNGPRIVEETLRFTKVDRAAGGAK